MDRILVDGRGAGHAAPNSLGRRCEPGPVAQPWGHEPPAALATRDRGATGVAAAEAGPAAGASGAGADDRVRLAPGRAAFRARRLVVTETPLIPAPLYGLRTWRVAAGADGEWITGVHHGVRWPPDGEWLDAACDRDAGHAAPHAGCDCGVHAWHPSRPAARRVLASRFELPGVVEATGAVEVHDEGFRAERARPHALVLLPGRNAGLLHRLAERYGAEVAEVARPDDLLAWCRERGLGLDERTVDELLGLEAGDRRAARRRSARRNALRVAAAVVVSIALVLLGLAFVSDSSGPGDRFGRTGPVESR
jgi:hypothetical protein